MTRFFARLLARSLVLSLVLPLVLVVVLIESAIAETGPRAYAVTEDREDCADSDPLRRPFFGDTHVHTARSQDASTQDTRVSPAEAYRFAKGEALGIQPFDAAGRSLRRVQLERPLDFAAITDHANQIGEVHLCTTPGSPGHDSMVCRLYRSFPRVAFFVMNARYSLLQSRWGFCGAENEHCLAAAEIVWTEHQRAAEEAYDRSALCEFTSFVAYEWTAAVNGAGHLHRNVLFRNERVPERPISVMETGPMAIHLWRRLDESCRDGRPGCEALTIPHNSNWSSGSMFSSAVELDGEITKEEAGIRARYDRLVEVMQHKGSSECALVPGVSDENCAFEIAINPHFTYASSDEPKPIDFARDALKRGLELERVHGVNPLQFGLLASTDTHLGTPGLVRERGFVGHGGAGKPGNRGLEPGLPDLTSLNPGGLAAVWAEENTRDALFAAMQRKEVYGTSGTRPTLRFFGGWDLPKDACEATRPATLGYARGVAMGGTLPPRPAAESRSTSHPPTFLVQASRDPHPSASDLERIEIVKGWVEDGERRERVMTIAGGANGSSVDLETCERRGRGSTHLCTTWQDPDFDPDEPAFYYARLLENPSCRWTQWACLDAGVLCDEPDTIGSGFEACCTDEVQPTIRERAWSSPIWYEANVSASRTSASDATSEPAAPRNEATP